MCAAHLDLDPARPAPPLQQVGLAGPGGGIVRHVVVRREQLDLGHAAVNDIHHVLDGDAGLSDVGADDDLGDARRHLLEQDALVLERQLRVERDEAVARAPEHGVLLRVLQEAEDLGLTRQEVEDSAGDVEGFDKSPAANGTSFSQFAAIEVRCLRRWC